MIKPLTIPPKKLAQSILSTDMSFILNNILDWAGNPLNTADFGSTCYAVFKNSTNTLIEIIEIDVTTIADTSIGILTRGMAFDGTLVSISTQALDWSANDTSVMLGTDAPQLWQALKDYIDTVAIAGAPIASEILRGLSRLSVSPIKSLGTCTITVASPGVISLASHGLIAGDSVQFSTSGALPTGINAGVTYYVIATGLTSGAFQISATLAGSAINTTGTQSGTHTLFRNTPVAIGDNDTRIPTAAQVLNIPTTGQKAGLAGSLGSPSAQNLFLTQENVSVAGVDQSQITQNASIDFGNANTTTLKNKLAQSFTPLRTKMRGVKLWKIADTGTFTGTVTVSLQADTTGSPSGSNLATVTLTNAQWVAILAASEFEVDFGTEYDSLVQGNLYWIVLSTSTSDTSNHPNIGTSSAGGYANGSAKFNNTTDGWVAIATIDLYFKTIEGIVSQVVETDSSGAIPLALLSSRGGIYVTQGNGTPPANGATLVITHNLGVIPKYMRMKAYGTQATSNTSFNIESYGIATFDALGAVTYHNIDVSDVGAATSWFEVLNSATDKILNLDSGNSSGDLTATIGSVTTNAFTLTFTLGATAPINNWAYIIEVFY